MSELNSHEVMKWLTDKQRDRFVKFQALFESDGWPMVVEMAQAYATAYLLQQGTAKTWDEVLQARGANRVWTAVANMADEVMNEFQVAAEQAQDDANASSPEADEFE